MPISRETTRTILVLGLITHSLGPVHTSNNVEATFDFVEATFDFVATNGNNVERNFVLSTKSKQIEHVQFVWSRSRSFVQRHFVQTHI